MKLSMGIVTAYSCYVGGYVITQILTPMVASAGFYVENLIVFMPQILARGLLAAIVGGITVPAIFVLKNININNVKDRIYYPTAVSVSILCWVIVIANALFLMSA
jgi:hypothetical protein